LGQSFKRGQFSGMQPKQGNLPAEVGSFYLAVA
jgi:hypothetical protein